MNTIKLTATAVGVAAATVALLAGGESASAISGKKVWACYLNGGTQTCTTTASGSTLNWAGKFPSGESWTILDTTTGVTLASGTAPSGPTAWPRGTAAVAVGDTVVATKSASSGFLSLWYG